MTLNIAIIGVGLIGGSIGLALRGAPMVKGITGIDVNPQALNSAVKMGAIDRGAPLKEGVRDADVVFICSPLETVPGIVRAIRNHLKPGCIVTDVGSTKQKVMEAFAAELPPGVHGIGGHPMAGSEKGGVAGADRYLFENAVYVLTPPGSPGQEPVETLAALVGQMGAQVIIMDPSRHDDLVAIISHLPHLVAVALVNQAAGEPEALMLAAGGFRDTTRIASSPPEMWEEILFSNREAVIHRLEGLITGLNDFRRYLADRKREEVRSRLEQAREIRESIPRRKKGLLPVTCELIAIVPDEPGVIGSIGATLGEKGINIVDIEILRVREGDGGTIRLGVPSIADAETAVELLRETGVKAWLR